MIIKEINNSWDFGESAVQFVNRNHRHSNTFTKKAAWYGNVESVPGSIIANGIFLGAGETYGANRNGDFFTSDDLKNCHHTFVTDAKHYKHHVNTDPTNNYGDVLRTFWNDPMQRVEGLIRIIEERSPKTVQKLKEGIMIPLSMACKVKYDVCSICGNKAKTLGEYCDHLKYEMGRVYDDGRIVCAYNPNPVFFDISEVMRGADPTAFAMRKVAHLGGRDYGYQLNNAGRCVYTLNMLQKNIDSPKNDQYNLFEKTSAINKLSILERLAALEKRITGMLSKDDKKVSYLSRGLSDKKLNTKLSDTDLMSSLAKCGMALKTTDFREGRIKGQEMMYNNLLQFRKRAEILEYIPDVRSSYNNHYDKNMADRSLLFKFASDRIESSSSKKLIDSCDNFVKSASNNSEESLLLKVAAFNLGSISQRPRLLDDPLYSELLILQNMGV